MDRTTQLATNFTVGDYSDLRPRLDTDDEQAWDAVIDALERRITERFLHPIQTLARSYGDNSRPGFAILALDCLLIDTIQSFKEGRITTGEVSPAASFRSFLRQPAFTELSNKDREEFFQYVRNAILHNGETRGGWKIRIDTSAIITKEPTTGSRVINRNRFHVAVTQEFQRYLAVLRDGESNARRQFLQRMDAIAGMPALPRPHYYFAYGSLLNEEQIAATIPDAESEGAGFLPNYRLVFDKHSKKWNGDAANITKDPTSVVWGFVYRVNDEEKDKLVERELGYDVLSDLTVFATPQLDQCGVPLRAFSFQAGRACERRCGATPDYVNTVVAGARARGLPADYIESIARERTTTDREPSTR